MSFLTSYLLKNVFQVLIIISIIVFASIPSNYYNERYYAIMALSNLEQTLVLFNENSKIKIPTAEFRDILDIKIDSQMITLQLQSGDIIEYPLLQEFRFKQIYFDKDSQNIVIIT
ncbi:MAG: hypothetical protein ACMXYB_00470 [Candidatus Woesearchaeota archaeon]